MTSFLSVLKGQIQYFDVVKRYYIMILVLDFFFKNYIKYLKTFYPCKERLNIFHWKVIKAFSICYMKRGKYD
jgi:hypothetical protein